MKVILVTQNAPLYVAEFLEEFLRRIAQTPHQIVSAVMLSPHFNKTLWQELRGRLAMYGLRGFFCLCVHIFQAKFYPSPRTILKKYKVPLLNVSDVNSEEFLSQLKNEEVDAVVSLASPRIFKEMLLHTPKLGCINYHSALLPKYRGRMPLFWAMLNDEEKVGITIHEMNAKLDDGPILVQKEIAVDKKDSLHSLYLKTIKVGPALLMTALEKLAGNDPGRLPNNAALSSQFGFPKAADGKLFRQRRKKFF